MKKVIKTLNVTAVQTEIFYPPISLFEFIFESLEKNQIKLSEKMVLVVTSKIVSLHEGREVKKGTIEKSDLIRKEA